MDGALNQLMCLNLPHVLVDVFIIENASGFCMKGTAISLDNHNFFGINWTHLYEIESISNLEFGTFELENI